MLSRHTVVCVNTRLNTRGSILGPETAVMLDLHGAGGHPSTLAVLEASVAILGNSRVANSNA